MSQDVAAPGSTGVHAPVVDRLEVMTDPAHAARQPSGDRLRRSTVDNAIIAVAFLVVGFVAPLLWHNGVSALLAAPAILVVPGWWLLKTLGLSRTFKSASDVALMVVSSMATLAAGASLMLWAHFWHPRALAVAVLAVAFISATRDCIRRPPVWRVHLHRVWSSTDRTTFAATCLLVLGATLWMDAAQRIKLQDAGDFGLVGIAPITWFLAVGVLAMTAVWLITGRRERPFLAFVSVSLLVVAIFALVPLHTQEPLYTWTYKHVGVARFLNTAGHTDPGADIYNRWPTFFGWSALVSDFLRIDIISLARWAEFLFVVLHCLLVFGLAKTLSASARVGGLAALIFLLSNWVGQEYFAPQPAAYAMYLGVMQLLSNTMMKTSDSSVVRLAGMFDRRAVVDPLPVVRTAGGTEVSQLILAGCLDAVLVSTHQLTPYLLVLQLGALTIAGYLRKGVWITGVATLLALLYLAPNYEFVQHKYGLFSGLNVFANIQVTEGAAGLRDPVANHLGKYLSCIVFALTAWGVIQLLRAGKRQIACLFAAMTVAPFFFLVGQSYGGEGLLRAYLFASPWCACIIASAILTLRPRTVRPVAFGISLVLAPLFVAAVYVNLGSSMFPRDTVETSEYFFAHAPSGSQLTLAGKNFPSWVGARYSQMSGPLGDVTPNVLQLKPFLKEPPGPKDAGKLAAALAAESDHNFLVFSQPQEQYALYYGPDPRRWTRRLERAVATSPDYRLWHSSKHARIYEVVRADG